MYIAQGAVLVYVRSNPRVWILQQSTNNTTNIKPISLVKYIFLQHYVAIMFMIVQAGRLAVRGNTGQFEFFYRNCTVSIFTAFN